MKKGTLIAGAVAGLFAMGAYAGDAKADTKEAAKVKCVGLNECKGKGACGGAGNDCAGKNACKGKGITPMSEADCKAKKGTVVADAAKAAEPKKDEKAPAKK